MKEIKKDLVLFNILSEVKLFQNHHLLKRLKNKIKKRRKDNNSNNNNKKKSLLKKRKYGIKLQ